MPDERLRELYALVDEAMAAGRATSLAALGAYHLARQGAFTASTLMTGRNGRATGRNWTGRDVGIVPTERYVEVRGGMVDGGNIIGRWNRDGEPRPFVVAAEGATTMSWCRCRTAPGTGCR